MGFNPIEGVAALPGGGGGGGNSSGIGDGGAGHLPTRAAARSTSAAVASWSAAEGFRICIVGGLCFCFCFWVVLVPVPVPVPVLAFVFVGEGEDGDVDIGDVSMGEKLEEEVSVEDLVGRGGGVGDEIGSARGGGGGGGESVDICIRDGGRSIVVVASEGLEASIDGGRGCTILCCDCDCD